VNIHDEGKEFQRDMTFFVDDQEIALHAVLREEQHFGDMVEFLRGSLGAFCRDQVAPRAASHDQDETFDEENFRALGELGFLAMAYPEAYGGLGVDFAYYNLGLESLAMADAGFALAVGIHGTACDGIRQFGSESLRERYLPSLISGEKQAAFCLSEAGSGSDAKAMSTCYRKDPETGDYLVRGAKYWITNGMTADVFFLLARDAEGGAVSAFVVEKGWEGGFEQVKIPDKMGVRGSNTAELVFDDYRIPAENLVGEEGRGFKYAMVMLNGGRATIASQAVGCARAAWTKLMVYAHERELFGAKLKDLDNTKKEISEAWVEIGASRLLTLQAALLKGEGGDFAAWAAAAKHRATEMAVRVSERAIQLTGGYGYVTESRIERHLRDALLYRIGEGANEALSIVVLPRFLYAEEEGADRVDPW
jgi:acyl-CoA dehydrogenase